MFGFISMVLPERHFGFIRYASDQGAVDPLLDCSVFFSDTELEEYVAVGDRVSFEVVAEGNGKSHAIDIAQANDRLHGFVDSADPSTHHRHQFCFIQGDDGRQFYCSFQKDVVPDCIGRRGLSPGTPVSFRVRPGNPGQKDQAVDVRNEDPALANIDPATHREFGRVATFLGDYGHIWRQCGDTIGFLVKNIITEGIEGICPGLWLEFGVTVQTYRFYEDIQRFGHRVFARDIAVGVREERQPQMASVSPDTPFDPDSIEAQWLAAAEAEPAPVMEATPQSLPVKSSATCLRPEFRRKTLRELASIIKAA